MSAQSHRLAIYASAFAREVKMHMTSEDPFGVEDMPEILGHLGLALTKIAEGMMQLRCVDVRFEPIVDQLDQLGSVFIDLKVESAAKVTQELNEREQQQILEALAAEMNERPHSQHPENGE